jgi:hypothetical protein
MSTPAAIGLIFPAIPACLLLLAARARRALDVLAPLQFASLVGAAILASGPAGAQGAGAAAVTVLFATAGLLMTVLRKERLAHQSAYKFDWEKFERDFHFYAITERLWKR